jgi:D-alanyl-D-alanine carboxypeptidase
MAKEKTQADQAGEKPAAYKRDRTILDEFRHRRSKDLAHVLSLVDKKSNNLAHQLLAQALTGETLSMVVNGDAEDIKQWLANGGVKFLAS